MSDDLESKARQKLRETSKNGHDDAAELYAKSAAAASDGDDDVAQTYYEAAEEENPDVGGGGGGGIVGTIVGLALLAFSAGLLLTMVSVGLASAVVGAFAAVWWFISFGILFPEQAPIGTAYWEALRNVHYIVGLFGTVWLLDRTARRLLVGYLSRIPIVGRGIPSLLRLARTAPFPVPTSGARRRRSSTGASPARASGAGRRHLFRIRWHGSPRGSTASATTCSPRTPT
jgi:hypothetical protein